MKLFILTREDAGYDEYDGQCVLARDEDEARSIADMFARDASYGEEDWLNKEEVECVEVDVSNPGLVLSSFNAG